MIEAGRRRRRRRRRNRHGRAAMAGDAGMRSPSRRPRRKPCLSMSLDEIIASNKRIAASANRTCNPRSDKFYSSRNGGRCLARSGNTPYSGSSSSGWIRSSSRRRNRNHRFHPYFTPQKQIPRIKPRLMSGNSWKLHVSNVAREVTDSILKVCEVAGKHPFLLLRAAPLVYYRP